MKKFINYLMFIALFAVALNFTSCQEEFEELPDGNNEEVIIASSNTAKLVANTASKDGSSDNIVDNASCFAVQFPYTVNVNGLDITIDSLEDLKLIEEIFDSVDTDDDIVEFLFPITITTADYSEIVINNKEELRKAAEECIEGGDDDDIECIDFVYPITLYTFDINKQKTGSVVVENDKQLRRFFANLEDNDLVSFDFPITLKSYDGTETVVDSNAELATALENAKEMCDEDDDDDHNDDDFTKERLDNYLVECPWLVKEVKREGNYQTDQYFEYLMNFKEDGTVKVKDRQGNYLEGEWSTRVGENRILLKLEFDALVDFTLEWHVYELEDGKIKFYAGDGDKIILKRHCVDDKDPDTLREVLKECSWIIKKVINDGVNVNRLLGFEFEFKPEGVVTLSDGETTSNGSWEITKNDDDVLVMAITMADEEGVSFEWILSDLRNDRLKFEIPDSPWELVLERNCDNDEGDEDVVWIRGLFKDTNWKVDLFSENQDPSTESYEGYSFAFGPNGVITVLNPDEEEAGKGRWFVYRNSENKLEMIITFGVNSPFYDLANDYKILEVEEDRLELKHENDENGYDHLIFKLIV